MGSKRRGKTLVSFFFVVSHSSHLINIENSTYSPVFNSKGECVGIAFQSLTGDAENIGK